MRGFSRDCAPSRRRTTRSARSRRTPWKSPTLVVQARWLAIEQEENTIPTPFLVVLVFWLAAMFTSFGLFAPRNAIAIAVLFLGALSLSASIFLIEELNSPLAGFITISSAPMYKALALLGH